MEQLMTALWSKDASAGCADRIRPLVAADLERARRMAGAEAGKERPV